VTLGNTTHDPVGEIESVGASYVEGDILSRCETLASVKAIALPGSWRRHEGIW
jgi:hypothetical protein